MRPVGEAEFWEKCIPEPSTGCWLWTAGVDKDGYGTFKSKGEPGKAHRFAWRYAMGPIGPGLCILHRCDNPPCVNPAHLFLGTGRENVADRHRKRRDAAGIRHARNTRPDRTARGEGVNTSKLTADQVREIRCAFDGGEKDRATLAREYGLSWTALNRLVKRLHWKHVA